MDAKLKDQQLDELKKERDSLRSTIATKDVKLIKEQNKDKHNKEIEQIKLSYNL